MTSANVVYAILSTVKDVGSAPSGHIYAAMLDKVSYNQYSGIIDGLVKAKLIKVNGHVITLTEMGIELVARVDSDLAALKKPD